MRLRSKRDQPSLESVFSSFLFKSASLESGSAHLFGLITMLYSQGGVRMNDTSLNDQPRLANYCLLAPFIKPLSLSLSIPPSVSLAGT